MNKVLKTHGLAVWISAALADLCNGLLSSECHIAVIIVCLFLMASGLICVIVAFSLPGLVWSQILSFFFAFSTYKGTQILNSYKY